MGKRESAALLALVVSGVTGTASADTRLSAQEMRWTQAALTVVAYARSQGLPVDIVVQPQAAPGIAPVALGLVDGRCKLVFSMRGNPLAEATDAQIPAPLFQPIAEAVAAHEMAHCWRHVHGAWEGPLPGAAEKSVAERWDAMQATRREEGFADLVGLAWTWRQHPAHYAQVHEWFTQERAAPEVEGSHHDTRAWLRLAAQGGFLDAGTPFEQVERLWAVGLAAAP